MLLATFLAGVSGIACAQMTGQAAFQRGEYARAADLWRAAAAQGSARAKLGLAMLNDLGRGVPRDATKARGLYLEAGRAGLAEAQFNAAIMLDAGLGGPRDSRGAAVWYARAAAQDHRRAQYNLGLVFASGAGVERNRDLARLWYRRAAESLPAAADRLAATPPESPAAGRLVAPEILDGVRVVGSDGPRASLVWTAPPAPEKSTFLVEVARLPRTPSASGAVVHTRRTQASAVAVTLPRNDAAFAWRVSRVSATDPRYAAAPWRLLAADASAAERGRLPAGRITVGVASDDRRGRTLANELVPSFTEAGYWVRIDASATDAATTRVRYGFAGDADRAASVAAFLPVLDADDAQLAPGLATAPGEIVVEIAGGPDRAVR